MYRIYRPTGCDDTTNSKNLCTNLILRIDTIKVEMLSYEKKCIEDNYLSDF